MVHIISIIQKGKDQFYNLKKIEKYEPAGYQFDAYHFFQLNYNVHTKTNVKICDAVDCIWAWLEASHSHPIGDLLRGAPIFIIFRMWTVFFYKLLNMKR